MINEKLKEWTVEDAVINEMLVPLLLLLIDARTIWYDAPSLPVTRW